MQNSMIKISVHLSDGHYYFQNLWTRVSQKYLSKVFCSGDAEHSLERKSN